MSNVRTPNEKFDVEAIIATVLNLPPEARQRVEDSMNVETKEALFQQEAINRISDAQRALSDLEGLIKRGVVITQENAKSLETIMAACERIIDKQRMYRNG